MVRRKKNTSHPHCPTLLVRRVRLTNMCEICACGMHFTRSRQRLRRAGQLIARESGSSRSRFAHVVRSQPRRERRDERLRAFIICQSAIVSESVFYFVVFLENLGHRKDLKKTLSDAKHSVRIRWDLRRNIRHGSRLLHGAGKTLNFLRVAFLFFSRDLMVEVLFTNNSDEIFFYSHCRRPTSFR